MATPKTKPLSLFDPAILRRAAMLDELAQARPARTCAKNPVMFVVEVGSVLTTVAAASATSFTRRRRGAARGSPAAITAVAVVHRALRQLRRGHRRGPRQGAGGDAPQDAHGDHRPTLVEAAARRSVSRRRELRKGDSSWSRPAR